MSRYDAPPYPAVAGSTSSSGEVNKENMTGNTDNRISPFASREMIKRARQLRREISTIEDRVWGFLRNGHVDGLKFRRQHPIGPYVVDFYCHEHRLAIEIDGPSHNDQTEYDIKRALWLNQKGYCVIRFTNENVLKNPDDVREAIRAACGTDALTRGDAASPGGRGERAFPLVNKIDPEAQHDQNPYYVTTSNSSRSDKDCSPPPLGEVVPQSGTGEGV